MDFKLKKAKAQGEPKLELADIKNHSFIVNNADLQGIARNKDGGFRLISAKQINGYYAVVETISTKQNELKFKTEFKENGKLNKNSPIFRDVERFLSDE